MFSSVTILLLVVDILVQMNDAHHSTKVSMVHVNINFDVQY